MKHLWTLTVGFVLLLPVSSGCRKKADPLQIEAARVHNHTVAIYDTVLTESKHLEQLLIQLQALRGATNNSPADSCALRRNTLPESGKQLLEALRTWNEQLVEVPGNEEDHTHQSGKEHAHDHHQTFIELTSEQMLNIQKHLRKELEAIRIQIRQQIRQAKHVCSHGFAF